MKHFTRVHSFTITTTTLSGGYCHYTHFADHNIKANVLTARKEQSRDMNPGHRSIEPALQPLCHTVPCEVPYLPIQVTQNYQKL